MDDLQTLVATILNVEPAVLLPDAPRTSIPKWDSFNHLMLISELEGRLGVSFTMEEIGSIQTLGQLHDLIRKKRS